MADHDAGDPGSDGLAEARDLGGAHDAGHRLPAIGRDGGRAEAGEVLRTGADPTGEEPPPERDPERLAHEMPRAERPVGRVQDRRQIDVDAHLPQCCSRPLARRERSGARSVAGGRLERRQAGKPLDDTAFLVGVDERTSRPGRVPVGLEQDDAAHPGRSRKPRDDEQRRLLAGLKPVDVRRRAHEGGDDRQKGSQRAHPHRLRR